jgi:hypothetical protein
MLKNAERSAGNSDANASMADSYDPGCRGDGGRRRDPGYGSSGSEFGEGCQLQNSGFQKLFCININCWGSRGAFGAGSLSRTAYWVEWYGALPTQETSDLNSMSRVRGVCAASGMEQMAGGTGRVVLGSGSGEYVRRQCGRCEH